MSLTQDMDCFKHPLWPFYSLVHSILILFSPSKYYHFETILEHPNLRQSQWREQWGEG